MLLPPPTCTRNKPMERFRDAIKNVRQTSIEWVENHLATIKKVDSAFVKKVKLHRYNEYIATLLVYTSIFLIITATNFGTKAEKNTLVNSNKINERTMRSTTKDFLQRIRRPLMNT